MLHSTTYDYPISETENILLNEQTPTILTCKLDLKRLNPKVIVKIRLFVCTYYINWPKDEFFAFRLLLLQL